MRLWEDFICNRYQSETSIRCLPPLFNNAEMSRQIILKKHTEHIFLRRSSYKWRNNCIFCFFLVGCVMSLALRVSIIRCRRYMPHLGRFRPLLPHRPARTGIGVEASAGRFMLLLSPLMSPFYVSIWHSGHSAHLVWTGCC